MGRNMGSFVIKKLQLKKLWIIFFLIIFFVVPLSFLDSIFKWPLLIFLFFTVICYVSNIRNFSFFLFSVAFCIRLIIVLTINTPPISDFECLLSASQRLLEGDTSFVSEGFWGGVKYFQIWAYQLGYVVFQSGLLLVWNNILMLQLFNCLMGAGTTVLVYLIAKEISGEKASEVVALAYCFHLFPLTYVTVLSNQFVATFLVFLGIYLLISDKIIWSSYVKYGVCASLLALANALRPESIIPLVAIWISLLLTISRTNIKEKVLLMMILIGVYFGLKSIISALFILTGLSSVGLANMNPYYKFMVGLNYETNGGWNESDYMCCENVQMCMEIMKQRILQPLPQLVQLFFNKIKVFWEGGALSWSFTDSLRNGMMLMGRRIDVSLIYVICEHINKCITAITYGLLMIGEIGTLQKNGNSKIVLLTNYIFVTFGVYLLIEVQSRYVYSVQVAVFILASLGMEELVKIRKIIRQKIASLLC